MMSKSALSSLIAIAAATVAVAFVPVSTTVVSSPRRTSSTSSALDAEQGKKKIFIDGEAGTTGLQVRDRLSSRADLEIISISDELRKDVGERRRLINEADCVILCEWLACALFRAAEGIISQSSIPGFLFFFVVEGAGRAPASHLSPFSPRARFYRSFDIYTHSSAVCSFCFLFRLFVPFRLRAGEKIQK